MIGNANSLTSTKPRGIDLGPIAPSGSGVIEVRVCVDERLGVFPRQRRVHALPCSSSSSSTNAALAADSISVIVSSSCAIAAKL